MGRRASTLPAALAAVVLLLSPSARAAGPDWKGLLARPDAWYRGPEPSRRSP